MIPLRREIVSWTSSGTGSSPNTRYTATYSAKVTIEIVPSDTSIDISGASTGIFKRIPIGASDDEQAVYLARFTQGAATDQWSFDSGVIYVKSGDVIREDIFAISSGTITFNLIVEEVPPEFLP